MASNYTIPPGPTMLKIQATLCPVNYCPAEFNSDGAMEKNTILGIKIDKNDNYHVTVRSARRRPYGRILTVLL